ncbi:gamma-glutamylcyclotransferase [Dyadobacter sp. CY323]|uniref:gamma-glutamylcyclotransferase family protein n=1 Tax=Dyadobacter sp. CY323 TaxID=2907302 RepID=UPI001F16A7F3|nr:gamma-glutamylcyclotransferase family protein [Dyadobacter sp. CY323]MCE6990550.1 gamma-glutamylcyclotransferase [Dyadobacter sp. CY323]
MFPENVYLFTYGTLKKGFKNPFAETLRFASVFEGEGYFNGRLYLISWYPGAVYDEMETAKVHGEAYRLTDTEILWELDEYEEVLGDEASSLYLRKVVTVTLQNGSEVPCWTYLYNQSVDGLPLISDGRFTV